MQPNSDIERRFRRTHISKHDFGRAGEFLTAARGHGVATIEHEALLIAAIIFYARPFTLNEKAKKGQDPLSDARLDEGLADFDDAEDQALHDRIVNLRHKAVAHAEFDNYPVLLAGPSQRTIVSRAWHVVDEQLDLSRFQRIATEMEARCTFGMYEDLMLR
jgi:hypothetical protein